MNGLTDDVNNLVAFDNLTEYNVLAVQPAGDGCGDELDARVD